MFKSPGRAPRLTALRWACALGGARSGDDAAVPDFSSNNAAWDGGGGKRVHAAEERTRSRHLRSRPSLYQQLSAARTGERANWRIADLTNPILKPWVVDALRKANGRRIRRQGHVHARGALLGDGVPPCCSIRGGLHFVQTPKQVWILQQSDHRVRRILSQSAAFGQSGAVLVRRIGRPLRGRRHARGRYHRHERQDVRRLLSHAAHRPDHVVERFNADRGGKALEVSFTVDDPGAFNMPWMAASGGGACRARCEEGRLRREQREYFNYDIEPIADPR